MRTGAGVAFAIFTSAVLCTRSTDERLLDASKVLIVLVAVGESTACGSGADTDDPCPLHAAIAAKHTPVDATALAFSKGSKTYSFLNRSSRFI